MTENKPKIHPLQEILAASEMIGQALSRLESKQGNLSTEEIKQIEIFRERIKEMSKLVPNLTGLRTESSYERNERITSSLMDYMALLMSEMKKGNNKPSVHMSYGFLNSLFNQYNDIYPGKLIINGVGYLLDTLGKEPSRLSSTYVIDTSLDITRAIPKKFKDHADFFDNNSSGIKITEKNSSRHRTFARNNGMRPNMTSFIQYATIEAVKENRYLPGIEYALYLVKQVRGVLSSELLFPGTVFINGAETYFLVLETDGILVFKQEKDIPPNVQIYLPK